MSKYRIKIETQKSGAKRYIPQIYKNFLSGWENIIKGDFRYFSSNLVIERYNDECDALNAIEEFKKQCVRFVESKIVKTEFKPVNL